MWAFARTVISNRVTVSMVVLAAIVLGLVGLSGMPWEMDPDVDFPFVTVIATYPGAGPDEIEEEVIRPLEDAVSVLSNVQHVNSVAQEGVGTVSIEFSFEADQDVAAADVRDAVARVKAEFPDDVDEPQVLKLDLGALPVMTIGVTGNRAPRDLRKLVDDVITPRIGQVSGVASVSVTGGEEREIHVLADRRRLEAAGLSIAELSRAIASDNLNVPAGEIDEGLRNYRVRVFGRADDIDTIRNIRIDTPLGGLMRVADLADIVDSVVDTDEYARINGENVVSMRVVKQSGANTVGVADGVRAALDELDQRLADDIEFTIASDDSEQVVTQIVDVRDSIVQGTILAALVIFLFLHNVRGMVIAALVIPVSIIASFSLTGLAFDFTLNSMVMLAFAISVGILVDNSVVILENVQRHLNAGELPEAAAVNGWSEIGWAVVATSVVDISIWFPVAIMSGIVGSFFYPFALTIVAVSIFALLTSSLLTPMLAAWWFTRKQQHETRRPNAWQRFWRGFYAGLDGIYDGFEGVYRTMLRWSVAHPYLVILFGYGALVIVAATVGPSLGAEFFPSVDQNRVTMTIEMPAGTRLEQTDDVAREIEQRLLDSETYPEIKYLFSAVGSTGSGVFGAGDTGSNWASMSLTLTSAGDRREIGQRSDEELADVLRDRLTDIPGAQITIGTEGGPGGGAGAPLEMQLLGENQDALVRTAMQMRHEVAQIPGLDQVDTSVEAGQPEVQIDIDRLRAFDRGMSVSQIAMAVRNSIDGATDTKYREGGDEYDIRVRLEEVDRDSVEEIRSLFLGLGFGDTPVRLGDVADVSLGTGPTKIERVDRRRAITLSAFNPGINQAEAEERILEIYEDVRDPSVNYQWAGQARYRGESFAELFTALGLAIALIYIATAALYNNVLEPLNVMFTVPLALIGALIGLLVTGNTLNIVSILGVIMLVGLVARNSIILIDFVDTLRARGMSRTEALLEAGPSRMRPILMTVASTVIGVLPTALALSEGAEQREPFAWVLVFGLIFGTTLSLLVIPASYCIWDQVANFFTNLGRRLFGGGTEPEAEYEEYQPPGSAVLNAETDGEETDEA